ncbi:UNVERIFIED_CONTAM: NF-X1-type zinc finger protein NFXL2 [Sesamum radiatum]|uniref:NF-X1-type zinc finger protein NFXL2 n=1 Tax=Sesamum radiatum TaxID=300843 RepID=A0AAW2JYS8_SESRA
MKVSVESVLFKGRGHVLVEREYMKGWHVMFLYHYVGQLARSCYSVGSIGALRCHRGPCIETCRTVVTKSCRCGSLKKQVPCYQELTCERKCQKLRDCGRHACKRRCCDGDCPPCSEVPCGTETEQKPPKCPKPCPIAPLCRHASNCKPHRCHYGPCPPCRLICDEEYSCGHRCKLRCHGPKPPPIPEFTLKPKKKKLNHLSEGTPGSSCPPCQEVVVRSCVGHHIGAERTMVCSNKAEFSCDNLCGNPLPCGNHYCTYVCHPLKSHSSKSDTYRTGESCEECNLPCQKEKESDKATNVSKRRRRRQRVHEEENTSTLQVWLYS